MLARVMLDTAFVILAVDCMSVVVVDEADDWNPDHLTLLSFFLALMMPETVLGASGANGAVAAAGAGAGERASVGGRRGSTATCSQRREDLCAFCW